LLRIRRERVEHTARYGANKIVRLAKSQVDIFMCKDEMTEYYYYHSLAETLYDNIYYYCKFVRSVWVDIIDIWVNR